jgi:hypothetical protein
MHEQATNALRAIRVPGGVVGDTIDAALRCVGVQKYGKVDASEAYGEWKVGDLQSGAEGGLNCWASCLFWAFQGGALKSSWLAGYAQQVGRGTEVNGNRGANLAREALFGYHTMRSGDGEVPQGAMIFFSTPLGPLSHVALAIGGGLIVSNWLNADKGTTNELLRIGRVHVETIETMKGVAGGKHCTVTWTSRPFWE